MSELALREDNAPDVYQGDPTGGRLIAWAQAASAANQLAVALSSTTFVPAHFRNNVGDATAAILMGDELGLSPLAAFRSIYVVHGTPALYARGMVALAQAHGHEVWTEKSTDASVTVKGRRKGSDQVESSTWDIQRAAKAGYTSNKKYNTNPQEMLYSKAAAEITRKIAADALAGVPYSVEELELEDDQPTTKVSRSTGSTKVSRAPKDEPAALPQSPADVNPAPAVDPFAITPKQVTAIATLAGKLGLSRDDKIKGAARHAGREIESTNDLSKDEAGRVIDALTAKLAEAEMVQGELVEP